MNRESPVVQPLLSFLRILASTWAILWLLGNGTANVTAEEPYQRFLQKLRDEQLFDLALVYLTELEAKPTVSAEFKSDIPLERGMLLYQSAAVLAATSPLRPAKLDEAESALRQFLESEKKHPRRGEARLKLGELLLTRAAEARGDVGQESTEDIPAAIQFYDDAHKLFESTIQELADTLEKIKGARIDPADTQQVAYRQKIRQDLRQAQLLSAKAVDDRGRSRAESSPQRKADMQQALRMFSDLYAKEQEMIGVRNYALYYRSDIQTKLGMVDDAIDGFQRIADLQGVDILRPLQTNAVTSLVKLFAEQGKYALAVDRADKWLNDLRPDERNTYEVTALKLELAERKLAWAESLTSKNPDDRVASRLVRDTRSELRSLLRVPGNHLERTKELLSKLGVENTTQESTELPKVKDFSEALAAAQERLERSETVAIGLESLQSELSQPTVDEQRKQELTQELNRTQQSIDSDQQQALQLLQQALRMFSDKDDRAALFDARFRLAYLLLKQQRPWDALVIGQFLARSEKGTDQGLRAAAIALGGFSDLLRTAGPERRVQLTDQLQPFAVYLVETWPQSEEASAAAAALVQLALMNKNWDQAEQFLKLVPASGATTSKLRRDAGMAFYAKYVEEKKAVAEDSDLIRELRTKAIDSLELGVQELTVDALDTAAVEALNALSRLLYYDGQTAKAVSVLFDSAVSPLKLLEKQPDSVPALVAMETYRTAIQLLVARLADGDVATEAAVGQMRELIKLLQNAAPEDSDGQLALAGIFTALARDLQEQLTTTKQEEKRTQVSQALLILAIEAAKSESFNTQYWAADTIVSIAQELESSPAGKSKADAAYAEAARLLEAILAKEKTQTGWVNPPALLTPIRLKLALVARGLGNYQLAISRFADLLQENNDLLDVQMEAARTYQQWGRASNSGFHRVAILGGRPDPKTGKKLIWGWGVIQERTANHPDFQEQFFEARLQLATSRMLYANGLKDDAAKAAELKRAEKDVLSTAKLYPALGGPALTKKFDAVLKSIQRLLGKPSVGLQANQ